MLIHVSTGIGEGPTPPAAFDAALRSAGVANYNLLCLSTVIPTGSRIQRAKLVTPASEYGNRLYVVLARQHEAQRGKAAWAGLGWTQDQASGRGLFVELHGSSLSQVESDIQASLEAMKAARNIPYGEIESEIVGIECREKPVCALVVAVYRSEDWR